MVEAGLEESEVARETAVAAPTEAIPQHVAKHVLSGTSTLGASVFVERGATFLSNVLAARLAGAGVFGAYSLGISTANNISTYAAGGIGATATRFSGKYPYDSGNYGTLARALAVVALVSAIVAAAALSMGAAPIAKLLHEERLTGLLHWAAISAAGMILLECLRGFFVGQRRLLALALLSLTVGVSMLSLLPAMAATQNATRMVVSQGSVTLLAVLVSLLLAKPLGLLPSRAASSATAVPFRQVLREVWGYGLTQLGGLLTANLAGWWVTVLVARSDTTLAQIGFFAVASQFRNLAGLLPGLLTEGSFAMMAAEQGESSRVPHRLMAICTFASTAASFLFAAAVTIVAPWLLTAFYGRPYRGAVAATAVGLGVAVLQMGNSPTSARLSIVSIRWTAVINTTWAVFTAAVGTMLMLHTGSAAEAMAVFFAAHVLMAVMVLHGLREKDWIPPGLIALFGVSTAGVLGLALLANWRSRQPEMTVQSTAGMVVLTAGVLLAMVSLSRRHRWLPAGAVFRMALARVRGILPTRRREGKGSVLGRLRGQIVPRAVYRVRRHWLVLGMSALRVAYWRLLGMTIGDGTKVAAMRVSWPHRVRLGRRCSLEHGVYFNASAGYVEGIGIDIGEGTFIGNGVEFNVISRVRVGRQCLIAAGCRFIDHNHGMAPGIPMILQPEVHGDIEIGDNVWLGVNAVVLKGVTIGDGAIVAAGSVVTTSVEAGAVVGGVPARVIRQRT